MDLTEFFAQFYLIGIAGLSWLSVMCIIFCTSIFYSAVSLHAAVCSSLFGFFEFAASNAVPVGYCS
jgi:hypothetical protein